jgi:CO dehydrogenase/acetyl-CoA synthase alpha subunit
VESFCDSAIEACEAEQAGQGPSMLMELMRWNCRLIQRVRRLPLKGKCEVCLEQEAEDEETRGGRCGLKLR